MAVLTRFGVYSISGADLTFADADVISGLHIVYLDGTQVAVFGLSPT